MHFGLIFRYQTVAGRPPVAFYYPVRHWLPISRRAGSGGPWPIHPWLAELVIGALMLVGAKKLFRRLERCKH